MSSTRPKASPQTGSTASNPSDALCLLLKRAREAHGSEAETLAASCHAASCNAPSTPANAESSQLATQAHDAQCASDVQPLLDSEQPVLTELVRSFLVWEAGLSKAGSAMRRFEQRLVDFNELRVCMHDDLVKLLGKSTAKAEERAMRLRATLNEIFLREHVMSLEHLPTLGKREAREYLESLEGVPRFVAARTLLLTLSGHAAPIDGRILKVLVAGKVVEAGSSAEDAAGVLEHRLRAGEMLEAYFLLQLRADHAGADVALPAPRATRTTSANAPSSATKLNGKAKPSNKRKTAD